MLASGQGTPVDRVEALKWHTIAKTAGKGDPELDNAFSNLGPEERARAEAAVRRWFGTR